MPSRRSIHGIRATSSSWNIMASAVCRPKNLATVRIWFLPPDDVKNRVSTMIRFTTMTVHSTMRAATTGGTTVRRRG